MNKIVYIILFMWLCSSYSYTTIQLDELEYVIVPVMYDECVTSSEEYYCDGCVCDECMKERYCYEKEESSKI